MRLTQDEKALIILDRMLDWRAAPLEDIQQEFDRQKIFGCREYLKEYGAHIMKRPLADKIWVYKNPAQLRRLRDDIKALIPALNAIGTVAVRNHSAFQRVRIDGVTRGAVDRALRENQCYLIGKESDWDDTRYIGDSAVFQVIENKELMDEDRNWMLNELKWILEEENLELGELDSEDLWEGYSYILEGRVQFNQFDLWIRILNANAEDRTLNSFLRVGLRYGY